MKLFIGSLLVAVCLARAQQSYAPPRQSYNSGGSRGFGTPSRRPATGPHSGGFSGGSGGGGFAGSSGQYQGGQRGPVVPILSFNQDGPIDGVYSFDFETGDGISRQEQGAPNGPNGAVVQQGSWSFTFPDGTPGEFSFIADENGYRVESPLLPVGPPIPPHALAQIEKAERERAQGIIHDGSYQHDNSGSGGRGGYQGQQGFQQSSRRQNFQQSSQQQNFRGSSQGQRSYGGYN